MKPPTWTLALPLLAFAGDALAWGLQTHLFFAQHVLLLAPLADPDFRRAALRFPRLVLAGACVPDLSLAGRALGTACVTNVWIPDGYKETLFTRFERLGKEGVQGTGLGLAIARRIVDLHGGKIWVEDNPEGGAVFLVSVRKAPAGA